MSSEASYGTSTLDEAVSKVEPEFEGLQKQEELSSSQDNVSDALLIRYIKFVYESDCYIINFINIQYNNRLN